MTIYQFPTDFKWGTATAAYQVEGAANIDGRGPSIWDTFSKTPGKVYGGDTGDVACDSYHRYKEDIQLMKELGVTTYRFSVSWPRVFPLGQEEVNQLGLDYYHQVVDELLHAGIEPMCTLYHWDLPQALEDKGGWWNRETIDAYEKYAELMFREFSGKIKQWITFNEPWCASYLSNYLGIHAPGHQDLQLATTIAHHMLVAHGKTVQMFRELQVEGQIGIAPNLTWAVPYTNKQEDKDACLREVMWTGDWFLDPIYFKTYPKELLEWFEKEGVSPPIIDGDMNIIAEPIDFIGVNYYSAGVSRFNENAGMLQSEAMDMGLERTDIGWPIDARGLYEALHYVADKYGNPSIYITENGACINDEPNLEGEVDDKRRVNYLKQHIIQLHRSIEDGINVKGYMAWSLLDNFEWAEGYGKRFGIVYVNFRTLERVKKESYYWYGKLVKHNWFESTQ
ncbi:GH1 family beta-glucosidase [Alkalihalobacterium bogoriense]|uniref:GH1 family beta-glucosidase n=1 Tax=Alkalihalobacterium bogoriense TaxID=246272 RepID=UPI00047CC480|nr:GH1 family beta-glucosidase [Alkalihalobacterium bogoriense]